MGATKVNIVMLGGGCAGKSAAAIRFVQNHFFDGYDPTIEDTIDTKVTTDRATVDVTITDTCGQMDFTQVEVFMFPDPDAVMIFFDPSDDCYLAEVRDHIAVAERISRTRPAPVPVVLVGTKADLVRQKGVGERFAAFLAEPPFPFIQTSSRTGENIAEAFHMAVALALEQRDGPSAAPAQPAKGDKCVVC